MNTTIQINSHSFLGLHSYIWEVFPAHNFGDMLGIEYVNLLLLIRFVFNHDIIISMLWPINSLITATGCDVSTIYKKCIEFLLYTDMFGFARVYANPNPELISALHALCAEKLFFLPYMLKPSFGVDLVFINNEKNGILYTCSYNHLMPYLEQWYSCFFLKKHIEIFSSMTLSVQ